MSAVAGILIILYLYYWDSQERKRKEKRHHEKLKGQVRDALLDLETEIDREVRLAKLIWPDVKAESFLFDILSGQHLAELLVDAYFKDEPPDAEAGLAIQIRWLKSAHSFLKSMRRRVYAGGVGQNQINNTAKAWESMEYDENDEPELSAPAKALRQCCNGG